MGVGFDPFSPRPQDLRSGFDTEQGAAVLSAGSPESWLTADPNRVTLIVQASGGNDIVIAPEFLVGSTSGIVLVDDAAPLVIDYGSWGPLVGAEWFGIAAGALNRLRWFAVSWRGADRR